MDRQIVYVGATALDTDQLFQSRNTMVALGYLAKMTIGDGACFADGLACTPAAGLAVAVGPGSMTLPTVVDSGSYGALPPDGDPLVKIGINTSPTIIPIPGEGTFVIAANVVEQSAGSAVISYYNASSPTQTMLGVGGDGQAQASVVQQRVVFAATSVGTVPTGYVPLWQVVVPSGATIITQGMISPAAAAPFIGVKLPQAAPLVSPAFSGLPTAPTAAPGDSSALLATTAFVGAATIRNRAAWGTGGSYSWTCPAGVSTVLCRMWGAGGNGGAAGGGAAGGGGGGGGYVEVLVPVVAGTVYPVNIGSAAGSQSITSFANLASATGGTAGGAGQSGQAGAGGTAGVASTNAISFVGALGVDAGQAGSQIGSSAIGGAGGCSFGVSGGGICIGAASGANGGWPGGGGAGGSTGAGGRGGDGLLVLEWMG